MTVESMRPALTGSKSPSVAKVMPGSMALTVPTASSTPAGHLNATRGN
ncbi:MAG: hypothetical protein M9908_00405 [Phyllobacteriaceae bacterium]|nr:hypothetical protein [Phyllobacteriaceae bacterium]